MAFGFVNPPRRASNPIFSAASQWPSPYTKPLGDVASVVCVEEDEHFRVYPVCTGRWVHSSAGWCCVEEIGT